MAIDFEIKFANVPALQCVLDDTELAYRYFCLLRDQYQQDPCPIFRDPQTYTIQRLRELATQAKNVLGWDWHKDYYDIDTTKLLHKNIEQYLSQGYENIPEEHDHLLDELHFCLHAIESGSQRNSWLQIEWFNDNGFAIADDEYPAKLDLEFGDIRLQNPYVGHHPLYLYQQQDSINVMQTCRFHDFAKPGINLVIKNQKVPAFDWSRYLQWFNDNAGAFLSEHGLDRLKKFTGHPVVGHVINQQDLAKLIEQPVIRFEYIQLH